MKHYFIDFYFLWGFEINHFGFSCKPVKMNKKYILAVKRLK